MSNKPLPTGWNDPNFRPVCGAVIAWQGKVLACERNDYPGQWQMPQGGRESDESWLEGTLRELEEETGITAQEVNHLATCEKLTFYHWQGRRGDTQVGPVLKWHLFEFTGDPEQIDVTRASWDEFKAHQWVTPEWLLENTIEFRQPGYTVAFEEFAPLIKRTQG